MGVVRFDEIAKESRGTFRGSLGGVPIVGLEHIEPYDMLLNKWDVDVETTFTKAFHKGQIMFGRRRAYQHKACVATCDGICSGDITLIEPVERKVYPDLLPFIVQNDDFFEHAIKGSNGALSPRVKWEHMASFEVNLPSFAEQKVLAEKLWAAYEVKQSYLKMIEATEEMVKSQFVEMFGNPITNPKGWKMKRLEEIYTVSSSKRIYAKELCSDGLIPFLKVSDIIDLIENGAVEHSTSITEQRYNELLEMGQVPKVDDILITSRGTIGKCYIVKALDKFYFQDGMITWLKQCKGNDIESAFFVSLFQSQEFAEIIKGITNKTTVTYVSLEKLSKITIPVPPLALQRKFLAIANQADKSISELRKSVDAIDKVIKSLINENL